MSLQIYCVLCASQVVCCIIDTENAVPIKPVLANVDVKSFLGRERVHPMLMLGMEDLRKEIIL